MAVDSENYGNVARATANSMAFSTILTTKTLNRERGKLLMPSRPKGTEACIVPLLLSLSTLS